MPNLASGLWNRILHLLRTSRALGPTESMTVEAAPCPLIVFAPHHRIAAVK